jgi:hypothetical protein
MKNKRHRPRHPATEMKFPHRTSEAAAAEHLCDEHSAALFSLAIAVTGDPGRAEAVVVDVISAACSPPLRSDLEVRRELSRRTYWLAAAAGPNRDAAPRTEDAQQRVAMGLVRLGGLDYAEAAAILGLPTSEMARLLSSGLHDLVSPAR